MPVTMLSTPHDIARLVNHWGVLPFFKGEIEGFSLAEVVVPEIWFPDHGNGVWDWKDDIMTLSGSAYGKFYRGKACFVSADLFPHLVNYRRSLRQPTPAEQQLLDAVQSHGSLLSRELKKLCGYTAPRRPSAANPLERAARRTDKSDAKNKAKSGFESAITRLQMDCRLLTADFEYSYTRQGERYGWSVARYCTPEDYFGPDAMATGCTPQQSRSHLLQHLAATIPNATTAQIERLVG